MPFGEGGSGEGGLAQRSGVGSGNVGGVAQPGGNVSSGRGDPGFYSGPGGTGSNRNAQRAQSQHATGSSGYTPGSVSFSNVTPRRSSSTSGFLTPMQTGMQDPWRDIDLFPDGWRPIAPRPSPPDRWGDVPKNERPDPDLNDPDYPGYAQGGYVPGYEQGGIPGYDPMARYTIPGYAGGGYLDDLERLLTELGLAYSPMGPGYDVGGPDEHVTYTNPEGAAMFDQSGRPYEPSQKENPAGDVPGKGDFNIMDTFNPLKLGLLGEFVRSRGRGTAFDPNNNIVAQLFGGSRGLLG